MDPLLITKTLAPLADDGSFCVSLPVFVGFSTTSLGYQVSSPDDHTNNVSNCDVLKSGALAAVNFTRDWNNAPGNITPTRNWYAAMGRLFH